ncbi:MAG: tRNA (adenosine(37)-N6)-dimethylallyltransferase MiaA [Hyphomicrobiaceae bacterium]|nr:tRNA (adenosine(37)-N6)-dimethylallyltransferase MiaA [Hyphomicrobiaceae bacterium]
MIDQRAILIAGPTASGKSALALRLAEEAGGSIINADSMQVYCELRILTARPSPDDEARLPHLLYGHVPAAEAYSAGRYAREAAAAIAEVRHAGRRPIIVGGTGLYFRALLQGLSPIPEVQADVRAHWRAEAQRLEPEALHALLAGRDPEMAARLHPTDPQRVTRALEVLDGTGHSLRYWQAQPGVPVLDEQDTIRLVVMPDRDELYRRCDARFAQMMTQGAMAEVASLAALRLEPGLPAMRALGVSALMQLLAGELTNEAATQAGSAETRQYAKRQLTWLRSNMSSWKPIETKEMKSIGVSNL